MKLSNNTGVWVLLLLTVVSAPLHVFCDDSEDGQCSVSSAEEDCGGHPHDTWTSGDWPCKEKSFGWDSFVCACSGHECDFGGQVTHDDDADNFVTVTSSRSDLRFSVGGGRLTDTPNEGDTIIRINPDISYQEMIGFGGAFTDSSGQAVLSLTRDTQDTLIRSYFAPQGIRYSLGRLPIGGSDFSTHPYSYDDNDGDVELEQFALPTEDTELKLPLVARASEVMAASSSLLLLASPWSPPAWMKTNGKHSGSGTVKRDMWQPYAQYIVKFLDAYKEAGANIWSLATQNEPLCSSKEEWSFNTCLWWPDDMRDWISGHLGPALHAAGYGHVKMIISDQVRLDLVEYTEKILLDQAASRYVSGIGVHWYTDKETSPDLLALTHARFPDKFIIYTEACTGYDSPPNERVKLGDWQRGEEYAANIIETSTHYSTGWVDWNMALDMQGGPNWAGNFVDAPIIVDKDSDTFYKQPMFYAMGHFSKYVERGMRVLYTSLMAAGDTNKQADGSARPTRAVEAAVFAGPDRRAVAVLLNTSEEEQWVSLQLGSFLNKYIQLHMPAKSIQTVLFRFNNNSKL